MRCGKQKQKIIVRNTQNAMISFATMLAILEAEINIMFQRIGDTLKKTEVTMKVNFEKKFKEVLRKESKGFDINWPLVDIKAVCYQSTLMTDLPMILDKYTVRMRVVEDEIPDMNIDGWFRSHKFIYAMMSKNVRTDSEEADMLTFDLGTIESIAMKTREAFRDFQGK